ncbi:hypothetical protein HUU61_04095 [Rhodopseudomonas palustris]|nr:hypothetical protein [Rhodopseudomonas palustris]
MARFRCRACGGEGEFVYRPGRHACPDCGSGDVQLAIGIEELPDDDPLIAAMIAPAETGDDPETND